MKNHIVSQLIIKRFSKAVNVFDLHSGQIDLSKKPHKVFYKNDRLSDDLEKLINVEIESRFANLLSLKFDTEGFVTLTREELMLTKKYLLMTSVRMNDENQFYKTINGFENNADRYLKFHPELSGYKRLKDLKLNPKETYELALRIYCECKDPNKIYFDSRVPLEFICWALPFIDSYLAIWDAPEGYEFVLSDCSMVSEYEGCHMITGGLDLSKFSYLYYNLVHEKNSMLPIFYADMISKNQLMYENYNVFNLSSKRCIVLINPFFRQYFGAKQIMLDTNERTTAKIPDIWPAVVQNKELFAPPVNEYKINDHQFTDQDLFFYRAVKLSYDELVYINSLIIGMSQEIMGFNNPKAILDSINYVIWANANTKTDPRAYDSIKDMSYDFCSNIVYSSLFKLSQFCSDGKSEPKSYFIDLFDEVANNVLKDFNTNKYMYDYLLKSEELTRQNKNLDFMGSPDERMKHIREKHDELWKN